MRIGKQAVRGTGAFSRAFTLIELILVMALLMIVISLSAPSLGEFFRGRALDSEARRFVSLSRYGQSRAVSEGVPVTLWIEAEQRTYGVRIETGYAEQDGKAVQHELAEYVDVKVVASRVPPKTSSSSASAATTTAAKARANEPAIRFMPDGTIGDTSPEKVVFYEGERASIEIVKGRSGLYYEISTNSQQNAGQ